MTVEKFLDTLRLIENVEDKFRTQSHLESVASALASLTGSPADTNFQTALATSLKNLDASVAGTNADLGIPDVRSIDSLGGAEFFDPELNKKVRLSIEANAMTPSVARDYVRGLSNRRSSFLKTAAATLQGLVELKVEGNEIEPGQADLSFGIPREIFKNELGSFATELEFLDKLLRDVSEVALGQLEIPKLEALSTTIPFVSVFADARVLEILAKGIEFFLAAWEKIEKIRHLRGEVAEVGLSGKALEQFDEKIEETYTETVEESVRYSLSSYSGADTGRKNELETALRQDFGRLFGQIERGLTVEFRAKPQTDSETSSNDPLLTVRDIGMRLKYPEPEAEPLLLTNGELLQGEITRVSKKTISKTSRRTRKASEDSTD